MPKNRTGASVCFAALVGLMAGCSQQPSMPPDTRAADEAAIRSAEAEWSKVAGAKDLERTVAYYAGDASLLPPNAPIATGKEAIREVWSSLMNTPGFALSFQSTKVEVARAGDLGYSIGAYELALNDAKGKPVKDRGKYATVWKKQADGSWKAVVDMFSSDLPATAAPGGKP